MISRCPGCGVPAADDARQCQGCGWDFVNNKKGLKKPEPPKKAEPPKTTEPPAAGFSLPPLGMVRLPKVEPGAPAGTPPSADENPFALPVARNLGPKPGESLFTAPPPPPAENPAPPPKKEAPVEEPPSIFAKLRAKAAAKPEPKPEPEPEPAPDEPEEGSAALFLPSSTKEIVVEAATKRPEPKESPEPVAAKAREAAPKTPAAAGAPKAQGRQSAVYLAALAGGALGLLSVCVLYVMLRSEPQPAARPTGSSPFGKRSSGDAGLTPNLDEPIPPVEAPAPPPPPPVTPAPMAEAEAPQPTALPAPVMRRSVEPPPPSDPVKAPAPLAAPAPVETAKVHPARPTATFAPVAKPKPATVAAAPKKPAGPQWVFEGVVYDLLSTRGAYGVRLVFVDADDNEVAAVDTAEDGRYRASMKPGPVKGYTLRIQHDDYSGKHIDELDSTSSVRKADLEQRKFLMQAGARSLPWIGQTGKPVRRDMALVPKAVEE